MKSYKHIKAREIRLLAALAALIIFAMATTTPTGAGAHCCGDENAKYKVTCINNHGAKFEFEVDVPILGLTKIEAPNVVVIFIDPRKNTPEVDKLQYDTLPLNFGATGTKELEKSIAWYYMVYELEYDTDAASLLSYYLKSKKPRTTNLVMTGSIIDDTVITIN
jgi:hypothetical protein